MATTIMTAEFLWKEIEKIINTKVEEMAQEQIEKQVELFREKLMEQKAEVITKILAKVFEMYSTFWKEVIIKMPIPE